MSTNKNRNGEQTATLNIQIPAFVANGIETGKIRLQSLEEQAQELIKELYSRGNREIEQFKDRIPVDQLREKLAVEDIVDRAKNVENETRSRAESMVDDAERKFHGLQDSILSLVGVASKEQVSGLARDLDRLSRRIDRLAKQAKAASVDEAAKTKATRAAPKKKAAAKARKTKS